MHCALRVAEENHFYPNIMGSGPSQQQTKTIESTGHVNNNFVVQETEDVYSMEIVILLSLLCLLKTLEFISFLYIKYKQSLKKKYSHGAQQNV